MKYLKKFNEELKPSTYGIASRKLAKMGHADRAEALKKWGRKMERDEEMIKWERNISDFGKFGTFKLNILNKKTGNKITGDFHLDINLDTFSFGDSLDDFKESESGNIPFFIGIIPTTKELINQCDSIMPAPELGNGFYWGMYLSLEFTLSNGELKFTKYELGNYDGSLSGDVSFADRGSVGKFKSLLKRMFTDPDLGYPSGYTDQDNFYTMVQNKLCVEFGLSSDYGFSVEQVGDFIMTLPANQMYKSI